MQSHESRSTLTANWAPIRYILFFSLRRLLRRRLLRLRFLCRRFLCRVRLVFQFVDVLPDGLELFVEVALHVRELRRDLGLEVLEARRHLLQDLRVRLLTRRAELACVGAKLGVFPISDSG